MKQFFDRKTPLMTTLMCVALAIVITIALFIVFSLLASFFKYPGMLIRPGVIVLSCAAVFISVYKTCNYIENKGWIYGLMCSGLYIIFLLLVGVIVRGNLRMENYYLYLIISLVVVGFAAGVIGINKSVSTFKR